MTTPDDDGPQTFDSVWDALEDTPAEALNMRLRSELMLTIKRTVQRWGVTPAEAARRLGVTQPRLADLLRGRIDRFELEALTALALAAGLEVGLRVRQRRKTASAAAAAEAA